MPAYSINATAVTNGSNLAVCDVACTATTTRPMLYDMVIGTAAAPADYAALYQVQRITAHGTRGSTVTPEPLDPLTVAASCDGGAGVYSVQPTITASTELLTIALNHRATFRWVAAPGSELIGAATDNNGITLESQSASTAFTTDACFLYRE